MPPITQITRRAAALCATLLLLSVSATIAATPSTDTSLDRQGSCTPLASDAAPPTITVDAPRPVESTAPGTVVSPTVIELRDAAQPGDRFTCTILIRNRRGVSTTYFLVPLGALAAPRSANRSVDFVEEADARADETAVSWVKPVRDSVQLAPDATARVPIIVTVPADAPDGGGYAAIAVRVRQPGGSAADTGSDAAGDAKTAPNVGILSEIAVPLLLPVGAHPRVKIRLRELAAPTLRIARENWLLSARIDNTGNVHVRPTGTVTIKSIFGNRVARFRIEGTPILPHGETKAQVQWRGVPWFGLYRVHVRIAPEGHAGAAVEQSRWLIALPPWWVFVLAIALIAAIVTDAVRRRRRRELYDGTDEYLDDDYDDADGAFDDASHEGDDLV